MPYRWSVAVHALKGAVLMVGLVALMPPVPSHAQENGESILVEPNPHQVEQERFESVAMEVGELITAPVLGEAETLGQRYLLQPTGRLMRVRGHPDTWASVIYEDDSAPSVVWVPHVLSSVGIPYRFDVSLDAGHLGGAAIVGVSLNHCLVEGTPISPGLSLGGSWSYLLGKSRISVSTPLVRAAFYWTVPFGTLRLGADQMFVNARGSSSEGTHKLDKALFQMFLAFGKIWELKPRLAVGFQVDAYLSRIPIPFAVQEGFHAGPFGASLFVRL